MGRGRRARGARGAVSLFGRGAMGNAAALQLAPQCGKAWGRIGPRTHGARGGVMRGEAARYQPARAILAMLSITVIGSSDAGATQPRRAHSSAICRTGTGAMSRPECNGKVWCDQHGPEINHHLRCWRQVSLRAFDCDDVHPCRHATAHSCAIDSHALGHEAIQRRLNQRAAKATSLPAARRDLVLTIARANISGVHAGASSSTTISESLHRRETGEDYLLICEKKKRVSCFRALRMEMIRILSPRSVYASDTTTPARSPRAT